MRPTSWHRIDQPGRATACVRRCANGWRLSGRAHWVDHRRLCTLTYRVTTDSNWLTRRVVIAGRIGTRVIRLQIVAGPGRQWSCNGRRRAQLAGCSDIDLAFTPATNQIALRRLKLAVGEHGASRAAYVSLPSLRLQVLAQTYRRLDAARFAYEAPQFDFRATLTVAADGTVIDYPGLFKRVTRNAESAHRAASCRR